MSQLPITYLLNWITGIISLAILFTGISALWDWYKDDFKDTESLVLGTTFLAISLFGRNLINLFLNPKAENSLPNPKGEGFLIDAQGTKLHIKTYGEGEKDLILIHGWGMNTKQWNPLINNLKEEDYRIITWDLPGLGKSEKEIHNDYSIEKLAFYLKHVIDSVAEKPTVLLGYSIGGMIILTFSRLYHQYLNNKVIKLIIGSSTYKNPIETTFLGNILKSIQEPILKPLLNFSILFSPVLKFMNWLGYRNGTSHLLIMLLESGGKQSFKDIDFAARFNLEASPEVVSRGVLEMFNFDESQSLKDIKIPTQIITGTADKLTSPQASFNMNRKIFQSNLEQVKSGHLSVIEQSKEFAQMIKRFISPIKVAKTV